MIAFGVVRPIVTMLVFALVASFGIASGARALELQTALRRNFPSPAECARDFGPQVLEMRRENRAGSTKVASECCHAARGGAQSASNGVRLAKQLASEAGSAELRAGTGKVMAGAGTKTPIRDAPRLVAEHGGQIGDWAKVTSGTHKIVDGVTVEVHGYMNVITREVFELKSKVGTWLP